MVNIFETDINLLTNALDASVSGIIITDHRLADNPIVYCNTAFEKISGYTRHEIIGRNCRFLQQKDREQPARQILKEAIEKGLSCCVEIRNYKKNGDLFWNELYLSPVKNDKGVVEFFIGVQNDITKRKHAEQELRFNQDRMEAKIAERTKGLKESQEYMASIIQTVRESLLVLDPKYRVITVNDHFLKTFKVSIEETENKLIYDLGNGQWDIPAFREMLENILPTNNPVEEFEVEHDFPHIGKKLMLLNAHRIELEGQYKDQILIAIEDITERKEIERRKDDFLSIASHELRTPLTTIKGYIQLMDKLMPADTTPQFQTILNKTALHVDRLNNLIAELLDVSRIQTGNIELHKKPFDFDKMVNETVENLQAAAKTHRLELTGRTGAVYNGDESHIIQVINNLVSNAIKYSPEKEQIKIFLSIVGDYIKVSVTDQGLGIGIDEQSKIFDRFYRVNEIQQKYPGMGIGLYVCQQIIKNHQGTLWVDSEKGKGSTFSFTLPLTTKNN